MAERLALRAGGRGAKPDNRPHMHLIVPFAGSVSPTGQLAQQTLSLPNLERLLPRLALTHTLGKDEYTLSPPHELALAHAKGWALNDGALPWAAELATQLTAPAGLTVGDQPWALLTLVHMHVGAEQVRLTDPAALDVDEATSRSFIEAVRPLFESEGFGLHWLDAKRWLATHPLFDGLATASLDRVHGRNVDPWLPDQRSARLLRRLQNEVQMVLYTHPLNEAREAAGQPPVNSFWCHGCGKAQAAQNTAAVQVDDRLRAPALNEDWAAWREAWAALDAGPIAALLQSAEPATLSLCGERTARTWQTAPRSLVQRLGGLFQRRAAPAWLEPL
jgi:hypothetical protein